MDIPAPLSRRNALVLLASLAATPSLRFARAQWDPGRRYGPPRATRRITIGGATIQIDFAAGDLDLSDDIIVKRHVVGGVGMRSDASSEAQGHGVAVSAEFERFVQRFGHA